MSADLSPGRPAEQEIAGPGTPLRGLLDHFGVSADRQYAVSEPSPARPTEQEWADQVRLAIPAMLPGYPERIAAALAPLIARVEEAAKAEGMAAVAGLVLALADGRWERKHTEHLDAGRATEGASVRAVHAASASIYKTCADNIRAAIPTDATEALARLKAQWQAEERERIARAWQFGGWTILTAPTPAGGIHSLALGQRVTDWLRTREAQQDGPA